MTDSTYEQAIRDLEASQREVAALRAEVAALRAKCDALDDALADETGRARRETDRG